MLCDDAIISNQLLCLWTLKLYHPEALLFTLKGRIIIMPTSICVDNDFINVNFRNRKLLKVCQE